MNIQIDFGVLAPSLAEQLEGYEVEIPEPGLSHLQADADAIARLHVRSMLSDAETNRARKRLMKQILKSIEETT